LRYLAVSRVVSDRWRPISLTDRFISYTVPGISPIPKARESATHDRTIGIN